LYHNLEFISASFLSKREVLAGLWSLRSNEAMTLRSWSAYLGQSCNCCVEGGDTISFRSEAKGSKYSLISINVLCPCVVCHRNIVVCGQNGKLAGPCESGQSDLAPAPKSISNASQKQSYVITATTVIHCSSCTCIATLPNSSPEQAGNFGPGRSRFCLLQVLARQPRGDVNGLNSCVLPHVYVSLS
jgi:hypothetical protein